MKNIQFQIIGNGQGFQEMKNLAKNLQVTNVNFFGKVPLKMLPELMSEADLTLGIFGDTEKAKRVVPNKFYSSIAMGKPIINGDSLAIREMPKVEQYTELVSMADERHIAESILRLSKDKDALQYMADHGRMFFEEYLTSQKLGKKLKEIIEALKNGTIQSVSEAYYMQER